MTKNKTKQNKKTGSVYFIRGEDAGIRLLYTTRNATLHHLGQAMMLSISIKSNFSLINETSKKKSPAGKLALGDWLGHSRVSTRVGIFA